MSKRQEIINQKKDILVDIDNDFFSYDAPMNYKNILAEIGQDDASNFHFTGKGNAIIKIMSTVDLSDAECSM